MSTMWGGVGHVYHIENTTSSLFRRGALTLWPCWCTRSTNLVPSSSARQASKPMTVGSGDEFEPSKGAPLRKGVTKMQAQQGVAKKATRKGSDQESHSQGETPSEGSSAPVHSRCHHTGTLPLVCDRMALPLVPEGMKLCPG